MVRVNSPFSSREEDYQYSGHGGHLGFTVGRFSAISDLRVTLKLQMKFYVNWPFVKGEENQNRY